MKTAMQELKFFISDGLDCFDQSIKVWEIWQELDKLIEKEKQQIIESFDAGSRFNGDWEAEENYYNETYKN
jgi:hypothetical protein